MIENDRIGHLGETEFSAVCERLQLNWSRITPDRTGKDCLIEWPVVGTGSLDTRRTPRRCVVQVKSTRIGSSRVRIKLSAADWLVKDLSPAFVVCPIFNEQDKVDHFVIFHISGKLLERLLTRLRSVGQKGSDLNRSWFNLTVPSGVKCESDVEIRDYLESEIGENMAMYAEAKSKLLATVGYDDEGPEYKLTFSVQSVSEIAECFLGKRSLEAQIGLPHRSRFKIRAVEDQEIALPPNGIISISPEFDEVWKLRAVSECNDVISQISVNAKSFAFPGIPSEYWQSEASNGLIKYEFAQHVGRVTFDHEALKSERFSLDVLIASVEFWQALYSHKRIHILRAGQSQPFELNLTFNSTEPIRWTEGVLKLLGAAYDLFKFCGVTNPDVCLSDLEAHAAEIRLSATRLDIRSSPPPHFVLNCEPGTTGEVATKFGSSSAVLITFPVILAEDLFAAAVSYSVKPYQNGDNVELTVQSRFPLRGKKLDSSNAVEDYENFVVEICEEVSPQFRVHHQLIVGDDL